MEEIITKEAQELYLEFVEKYISKGYINSGMIIPNELNSYSLGLDYLELLDLGIIQRRRCGLLAYELVPSERARLVKKHKLDEVWTRDNIGKSFYPAKYELSYVMQQ